MTDKLKELIEKATYKPVGDFASLMFVSNGEYDGFFGKNGYDNLLILGCENDEWYKISDYGDAFCICTALMNFNLDIPSDYGVPRIWFYEPVHIDASFRVSTVIGQFEKEKNK